MFGWIFSSLLFPIIKFKVTVRKLRNYVLIETHPPHWLWSVPRWRLLQACDCCQGDYQRHKLLHRKLSLNRTLLKTLYRLKYRCLYRHANHLINTRNSLFYCFTDSTEPEMWWQICEVFMDASMVTCLCRHLLTSRPSRGSKPGR